MMLVSFFLLIVFCVAQEKMIFTKLFEIVEDNHVSRTIIIIDMINIRRNIFAIDRNGLQFFSIQFNLFNDVRIV